MSETEQEPNYQVPEHLSPRAVELWHDVVPRRAKSPGRVAIVRAALEALDRADAARAVVAEEGLTTVTETTKAVHVHPCVKVEREARAQFTKLWDSLNFVSEYARGDR